MDEFKAGDIVFLKSDALMAYSLYMTVNWVNGDEVSCIWKDANDSTFRERTFYKQVLQKHS